MAESVASPFEYKIKRIDPDGAEYLLGWWDDDLNKQLVALTNSRLSAIRYKTDTKFAIVRRRKATEPEELEY